MTEWTSRPGAAAHGWEANADRIDEHLRPVTEWLLERAAIRAGDTVLDVAAGPGGVGHAAAPLVGSRGRVLSTDLGPAMVDAARRIGERLGLTNVEYHVFDAQAMDLPDNSVDAVVCRSGYMLMPDPLRALEETRRVLRAGGNLAFSVFAAPDLNPFPSLPVRVMIDLGHLTPPPPGSPGVFAMSDPARIQALLADAGFDPPTVEAIEFERSEPDEAFIVDRVLEMNPYVSSAFAPLDDEQRADAREALIDAFSVYRQADGSCVLPTQMWGVHTR